MSQKPLFFQITREELDDRLTVEFYLPEYRFVKKQLKRGLRLGEIASVTSGHTPRDKSAFKGGSTLFLKTQHVHEGYLNLEEPYYITEEAHNSTLRGSKVSAGDVLLTIIGASHKIIGRSVVFPDDLGEANINQNIAGIRVFDQDFIKPDYVEAFLNSPLGRAQSQMMSRVVGQYNLNLAEVRSIMIPMPRPESQEKIAHIWEKAKKERREKSKKITELFQIVNGDMVFSDLGIKIPRPEDTGFFMIQGEDLQRKLTVEYYRSKLVEDALLMEKDKLNLQKLDDLAEFRDDRVDPKENPETFHQLLNVGLDGKTKLREERLGKEIRYKYMKKVKEGDILVSRISAIYGASSVVPKELHNGLVSSEYYILNSDRKKLINVYLWKILRSEWIRAILEGFTTGGSRLRVSKTMLKELMIPIPPLSLQKTFSSYILQTIEKIEQLQKEVNTTMINAGQEIQNEILNVLQDEKYDVFRSMVEKLAKNIIDRNKDTLIELAKY
jgi:restriction endonuclease S subunit